jgi:hypothetical protein
MLSMPGASAVVYVTEQLVGELAPAGEHVVLLNVPAPDVVNVTVPVGADFVPVSVSVTVAVHVLFDPAGTGDVQLRDVLVLRLATVRLVLPELVLWTPLPP